MGALVVGLCADVTWLPISLICSNPWIDCFHTVDYISFYIIVLTDLIMVIVIVRLSAVVKKMQQKIYTTLLILILLVLAFFSSRTLLTMYVLFEMSLIPILLVILG